MSLVRALASVLVLGGAIFYSLVAVKGVGALLLGPPPEMVTTAGPAPEAAGVTGVTGLGGLSGLDAGVLGSGDGDLEVLLRPLAVTGAALAGLLLLWSGVQGLRSVRHQRPWRSSQIAGLVGLGVGTLAFGLGVAATDATVTDYVRSAWQGVEPIRPSAALALLVGTLALLAPAPRRSPGRPQG